MWSCPRLISYLLQQAGAFLLDSRVADSARSRLGVIKTLGVEDDIWSPRHGLKGKIDVTLDSSITDSIGFNRRTTIPFEIKTGRANAGMEHRAQTMLYTLLMSDLYGESRPQFCHSRRLRIPRR